MLCDGEGLAVCPVDAEMVRQPATLDARVQSALAFGCHIGMAGMSMPVYSLFRRYATVTGVAPAAAAIRSMCRARSKSDLVSFRPAS